MDKNKTLSRSTNKSIAARSKQKDWVKKLESLSGQSLEVNKSLGAVYLVVDCSVSMSGNKLEQAKSGGKGFAEEAHRKGYAVGLIQFGSDAKHLLEPQHELSGFSSSVEMLTINGSTNMAAGIRLAMNNLSSRRKERVICLVTDGQPDDRMDTLRAADAAKGIGIDIMTIGTDDADKIFLEELATRKELSLKVVSTQLQQGITSMAKMLPDKT